MSGHKFLQYRSAIKARKLECDFSVLKLSALPVVFFQKYILSAYEYLQV